MGRYAPTGLRPGCILRIHRAKYGSRTVKKSQRQSKTRVYLHLVWATYERLPLLTPEIERAVYRCIESEATRLKCKVLAIGGMPDHVHLAVQLPATIEYSRLMNQIKGVSSHFVHDQLPGHEGFKWQSGYGAYSVDPDRLDTVISYINHQKDHHTNNTLCPIWEDVDEEYMPISEATR
jgi:putative transposase